MKIEKSIMFEGTIFIFASKLSLCKYIALDRLEGDYIFYSIQRHTNYNLLFNTYHRDLTFLCNSIQNEN